ncbi:hypothetical protein OGAPHI_000755 [Ogataea philodendri]|uniref:AN1-type domain-containing protein n=2 Tax=Ogataea TaxID=461281 RepID=A0A9P8T9Y2_9ASCO|nr:uncharacterized protein OGAPHI_000755 [Ogataea philodendri]KAH3671044.1 hypothetical protein OGAPHI_000755 [Ogataea philodendri]
MKVTVKSSNDQSFQVTVPDNSTVDDLKVAAVVALPPDSAVSKSNVKVWYSGKKMELSKTLDSYGIGQETNSTVYLTCTDESSSALTDDESTVVEQPKTKVRRKSSKKSNKCSFETCHSAPLRMVGDCSFCQGKFCSKHRLLESHNCKGLQTCKEKSYERNALKLQSEQTVASKV